MIADVRLAEPSDIPAIASFMLTAGAGLYEHLLTGLIDGLDAADLLSLAIAEDGSPYFYGNALIAWEESARLGLTLGFPAEELGLPQAALDLIPPDRLQAVQPLFDTAKPGSFYLNSVAVSPSAERRGVARLLLETTARLAQAGGLSWVSLHVWTDNAPAMRLYRTLGFEAFRLIELAPSPHFTHSGPVEALAVDTDRMLERLEARR